MVRKRRTIASRSEAAKHCLHGSRIAAPLGNGFSTDFRSSGYAAMGSASFIAVRYAHC
jgi:hypothetical protein